MPHGHRSATLAGRTYTAPADLLLVSGETPEALLARVRGLDLSAPLRVLAGATRAAFVPDDQARLAVVASPEVDLAALLGRVAAAISARPGQGFVTPRGVAYGYGDREAGRIGFLFSGHGGEYVGMGADLASEFPAVRAVWDAVSGLDFAGRPLRAIVGPAGTAEARAAQEALLAAAEWAQPAVAAQCLAQLELLGTLKVVPEVLAGHGVGELVARHVTGLLDARALVRLARKRGEAVRDAVLVDAAIPAPRVTIEAPATGRPVVCGLPAPFAAEVEAMYSAGVRTFVELGAGTALTGLVGRVLDGRPKLAVSVDRPGRHGVVALFDCLGRLAVNGVPVDFAALSGHAGKTVEETAARLSVVGHEKPPPAVFEQDVRIRSASHPYLADHRIQGSTVLPVAVALEWFTAARRVYGSGPVALRNVRVLRRVSLAHFDGEGDRVKVRATKMPDASLMLELRGEGNVPHYRAQASLGGDVVPAEWPEPAGLEPVGHDFYDGLVLFHGTRFRALRRIRGIGDAGAAGVLTGLADLGWPGGPWQTDPAAIDGGLQLAVLWGKRLLGRATLPMSVAEFRVYRTGPFHGPIRCLVRPREIWADGVECDIGFFGADESALAELVGVSLVPRPSPVAGSRE